LHIGRVNHGEQALAQPLASHVFERLEGSRGGRLVILVVGDEAAEEVAREGLEAAEVFRGERRLARAAGADEQHERHVGQRQRRPLCVRFRVLAHR
jgi:hypothetical protein